MLEFDVKLSCKLLPSHEKVKVPENYQFSCKSPKKLRHKEDFAIIMLIPL